MSSPRSVVRTAGITGLVMLVAHGPAAGSGASAFTADIGQAQSQVQPRDPRPGVPRPASTREQTLQAAIKADPSDVADWVELAKLQEERGATDQAEATFKAAISATGSNRAVLSAMAAFFNRSGHFEKTMAALEELAAQSPADATGHYIVATYYWAKAQKDPLLTPQDKLRYIEAGIAATDRALAQNGEYVEALTYKNILLRMKGNLETDENRRAALFAEADALRDRALELSKLRTAVTVTSTLSPTPPPPPPPPSAPVRVGGTIKTPTKVKDVRPVYPQEARDAGISGMVILEAVIDTQGNIESARILRSIPLLDQAAVDAVRQWRFTPTYLNGAAVPVIMTVTVNFTVQDPEATP